MADKQRIDINGGKPLKLVEDVLTLSMEHQRSRNSKYSNWYKLYHGFIDESERDPDFANIFIPKTRSIVEAKAPRDIKALAGRRPYIPMEARRPEFRESSKIQTSFLDENLYRAGFYPKLVSADKIKILYGTSFMESIPYFETVTEKRLEPEIVMGMQVGMKMVSEKVPRLRLHLQEYAPWEVYVDPYAVNLEEKGGCRYVVKIVLTHRDDILELARNGSYPDLDVEKFKEETSGTVTHQGGHKGLEMLTALGLPTANESSGVGVLMRFESEDRYVDVWNGRLLLRDIPNPYKHGMINLSRFIHIPDPHPQNAFWGIGEGQCNEVLQVMLNDSWNLTFDSHNMMNQGITYYKKGSVNPDALVRTVGNKVAVDMDDNRPLSDYIHESFGQPLPQDHYNIPNVIERMIDLSSNVWDQQRGEQSASNRTATESVQRQESGDAVYELSARMGEMVFMKSFGERCLSIINQFATRADVIEVVGEEAASQMMGLNPHDLPGGFNYAFKGADRVASLLMKQRNWKELLPILMQIPGISPEGLAKKMLEVYEEDDANVSELVTPDEESQQQAQQSHEQEIVEIEEEKQRDHQRNIELALLDAQTKMGLQTAKDQTSQLKDNNRKSKPKGVQHSKNQPSHDGKSEAQHKARTVRGAK